MLHLASPLWLLLLPFALIPAAFATRRTRHPALRVSALPGGMKPPPSWAGRLAPVVHAAKGLALILLILALARPQWGTEEVEITTEGINIVLAVDLSESMAALDFKRDGKVIDRLEAAKGVVEAFVAKRQGDRIGLVVFGSSAYTQLPLTRDYNTIVSILERLRIGAAGKQTAIGDAVGISLKRLADIESRSNVVILLTDGRSNAGDISPETAADIARSKGIKVYTIGVGSRGEAPFLVTDPLFGKRYVYQRVDIDEETLKNIAEKTSGRYFRAEDTQGLQEIYDTIDQLEKTEIKVQTFSDYTDLYPYLLFPGFGMLLTVVVLLNTRFLRIP